MPSTFARANGKGASTRIPTGRMIAVRDRICRKISYDGMYASLERIPLSSVT